MTVLNPRAPDSNLTVLFIEMAQATDSIWQSPEMESYFPHIL